MKTLVVAAALMSAIGIGIICAPSVADAQQRGRTSDLIACPIGTCGPQGGRFARRVEACKPANCTRR